LPSLWCPEQSGVGAGAFYHFTNFFQQTTLGQDRKLCFLLAFRHSFSTDVLVITGIGCPCGFTHQRFHTIAVSSSYLFRSNGSDKDDMPVCFRDIVVQAVEREINHQALFFSLFACPKSSAKRTPEINRQHDFRVKSVTEHRCKAHRQHNTAWHKNGKEMVPIINHNS